MPKEATPWFAPHPKFELRSNFDLSVKDGRGEARKPPKTENVVSRHCEARKRRRNPLLFSTMDCLAEPLIGRALADLGVRGEAGDTRSDQT
jgi:hypothetical protein